jgi:polyribonucleotide nucleotidyltransferase
MISDITAVPEPGKTYLGKVVRLAEFGAFVEIFPGTDGLLHVSEIAEHRVARVQDELREGDQILVKVLSIEGNRIKLSRKAVLKEQRAKLGLPDPEPQPQQGSERGERGERGGRGDRGDRGSRGDRGDRNAAPAPAFAPPALDDEEDADEEILIEGGADFDDDEDEDGPEGDEEPNFNRADVPVSVVPAPGGRGPGGPAGGREGGGGNRRGGRRRRGRRPGGGGAPSGGGGGNR